MTLAGYIFACVLLCASSLMNLRRAHRAERKLLEATRRELEILNRERSVWLAVNEAGIALQAGDPRLAHRILAREAKRIVASADAKAPP